MITPVHAGMTVITLTDIAEMRLQSISFFAAIYLVLALIVKFLWNHLAKAFAKLPRITYLRSLCLMLVSGLFLYVILTMISGARELMTPGAWKKKGIGYELTDSGKLPEMSDRKRAMEKLKTRLWNFAKENNGDLPNGLFDDRFPMSYWELPEVRGYYAYIPAGKLGESSEVLVYEPSVMGEKRYVLLSDGSVVVWTDNELETALMNYE